MEGLKRAAYWLVIKPWLFWVVMLAAFAPLLAYSHLGPSLEKGIRYHATGVQVMGLLLVAKGLFETARRFGKPAPWQSIANHIRLAMPPKIASAHARVSGSARVSASGSVSIKVHRTAPTDAERIAELERQVEEITTAVADVRTKTAARMDEVHKRLNDERQVRETSHRKTMDLLDQQIAGGVGEGYLGVLLVFCGTIYSGFAPEIVKWFS